MPSFSSCPCPPLAVLCELPRWSLQEAELKAGETELSAQGVPATCTIVQNGLVEVPFCSGVNPGQAVLLP